MTINLDESTECGRMAAAIVRLGMARAKHGVTRALLVGPIDARELATACVYAAEVAAEFEERRLLSARKGAAR